MIAKNSEIKIREIVRSNRKTVGLQITETAELIVRAPHRMSEEAVLQVVARHQKWIERKKREVQFKKSQAPPKQFVEGESFRFLGKSYPLKIVPSKAEFLRFDDGFYLSSAARRRAADTFTRWYIGKAREIIPVRVENYATEYGFQAQRLRISRARTRWGSCSSRGHLNFSWRLVMAPLPVIDYVVVHELVHLKMPNHSPEFWTAVEQIIPGYKTLKLWLKENEHLLRL